VHNDFYTDFLTFNADKLMAYAEGMCMGMNTIETKTDFLEWIDFFQISEAEDSVFIKWHYFYEPCHGLEPYTEQFELKFPFEIFSMDEYEITQFSRTLYYNNQKYKGNNL